MILELRQAARALGRNPAFTLAAVFSLALGIGANTVIFSYADGSWFRPLPVREPDRLVRIFSSTARNPLGETSYLNYLDLSAEAKALSGAIAVDRRGPHITLDGVTQPTQSHVVSDNYFTVLGVNAARGRVFTAQDAAGDPLPIVISHSFWMRRLGGDPNAAGKAVEMNRRPFVIIGIAPPDFRGTELWTAPDLWMPMRAWLVLAPRDAESRATHRHDVFARLRDGVSAAEARTEIEGIGRNLARAHPAENKDMSFRSLSLWEVAVSSARDDAGFILGLVAGLVLLIACVNVANLLLVRAEASRREIAIRLSIGCGRGRLIRQLLTESMLLALLGAAAALVLAVFLIDALPLLFPGGNYEFRLDGRVLAFAFCISMLAGLLFGLAPSIQASRPDLLPDLKGDPPRAGTRRLSLREALVVAQVAISVVPLLAAGLLVRSLIESRRADLGFERKNVLFAEIYSGLNEAQGRPFFDEVSQRVAGLPGVKRVALVWRPPLWPSEGGVRQSVVVPAGQSRQGEQKATVKYTIAGPGYLRALSIPLLQGRDFEASDNAGAPRAAIINETMARRFWGGEDAVGKYFTDARGAAWTVVGVVRTGRVNSLEEL